MCRKRSACSNWSTRRIRMAALFSRKQVLRAIGAFAGTAWLSDAQVPLPEAPATKLSMPGLYPGRVVGVYNPGTLVKGRVQADAIRKSIRKGMAELTDTDGGAKAWKKFFEPDDIVGIKLNPNSPHVYSSPEVLHEIVSGLASAGVPNSNIVVYDRYRQGLLSRNIPSWLPEGVRSSYAAAAFTDDQTGINGYDPEHYVELPLVNPNLDPRNVAVRRSYAAKFITREVTKLINVPVLKDHQS